MRREVVLLISAWVAAGAGCGGGTNLLGDRDEGDTPDGALDPGNDHAPDALPDVEDGVEDDASDAGGDGEDTGAACGNGTVEPGEDCEGTGTLACDTTCGRPGTRHCVGCRWAECEAADAELCNATDDDCDGFTDEDFACVRGHSLDCPASCGSTGSMICSGTCEFATCAPPLESCNGRDDDCDTVADNGFGCIAGGTVPCTTTCGTTGSGTCTSACTVPAATDCRPPAETCNGADDDCNGLTDEGLWAPAPTDVRITSTSASSIRPEAVWRGATRQYGLVWVEQTVAGDGGEIYFTLLDEYGADDLAPDAHVSVSTVGVTHEHPALAWSTSQWGVVWSRKESEMSELHFNSIEADGGTLGGDVQVTSAVGISNEPSLLWVGAEYGVAWNDAREGNREIYFARLSSSGSKATADERLTMTLACLSSRPSLAWTGTEYGVAWYEVCPSSDQGDIYFTRITAAGTEVGEAERGVVVHSGAATWPRLVYDGSGYGMAWLDDRDVARLDQLYFARLDSDGVIIGSIVPLTTPAETGGVAGPASLAWDAARLEYMVAWSDQRNAPEICGAGACGTEIYFLRIDSTGHPIGAAARATVAAGDSGSPWLAIRTDGYGIVWTDDRDVPGVPEIYFNTLRCR